MHDCSKHLHVVLPEQNKWLKKLSDSLRCWVYIGRQWRMNVIETRCYLEITWKFCKTSAWQLWMSTGYFVNTDTYWRCFKYLGQARVQFINHLLILEVLCNFLVQGNNYNTQITYIPYFLASLGEITANFEQKYCFMGSFHKGKDSDLKTQFLCPKLSPFRKTRQKCKCIHTSPWTFWPANGGLDYGISNLRNV